MTQRSVQLILVALIEKLIQTALAALLEALITTAVLLQAAAIVVLIAAVLQVHLAVTKRFS